MGIPRPSVRPLRWMLLALLAVLVVTFPAGGAGPKQKNLTGGKRLTHISQSVAIRFWAEHPEFAPKQLSKRLQQVRERAGESQSGRGRANGPRGAAGFVFNDDLVGLPQNEESITACRANTRYVLGSTNDYRGLLDPAGNFTGWHFSSSGGNSLTNEGLMPPVSFADPSKPDVPSGGDPVSVTGTTNQAGTGPGCAYMYEASLAYDPVDPFGNDNGIAVYRSTPQLLGSCPTGTDPANPDCWPVRRLVAEGKANTNPSPANPSHFLDKEWMDVGRSGSAEYVWVTWSDFAAFGLGELDFTAEIFAARCTRDLATCTAPIPISVDDFDVQFSHVTIGPDGRVYISWVDVIGEVPNDPECPDPDPDTGECPEQTFVIKLRVAQPGSTTFGPERVVYREEKPIAFGGFLNANDFRIATYPKNDVAMVGSGAGHPRVFIVWDACRYEPTPTICEGARIRLTWSDDFGATWRGPITISRGGNNYFPSIDWNDRKGGKLAFAWFSNRRDTQFDNRQDIEYLTLDSDRPSPPGRPRVLTRTMNESEADPLLGGFFIGDYIEVAMVGGRSWVNYNANYQQLKLLGPLGAEGIPVPQQDNYLDVIPGNGDNGD
jgi:hypothetical protein